MTGILDSAVLVDLLRGYPPSEDWIERQGVLALTPISWLEILAGAKSSVAQNQALRLLRSFERIDLTSADFDWAIQSALQYHLSHGIDMNDCLIAAPSQRLQIPLFTRNRKHFEPLLGALALVPY